MIIRHKPGIRYLKVRLQWYSKPLIPSPVGTTESVPREGSQTTFPRLCGGAGETGALLVRHGCKGGPSFDLVVGINLLRPEERESFLNYLKIMRPKMFIISTPCTGMKGFRALSRSINHPAWMKSCRVSAPLGKLAGEVASFQM